MFSIFLSFVELLRIFLRLFHTNTHTHNVWEFVFLFVQQKQCDILNVFPNWVGGAGERERDVEIG